MNAHDLLLEVESIEHFCADLESHLEKSRNNTLWLIDELKDLQFRAESDLREFNEKAEFAIGHIRSRIESVCDQLDELHVEQRDAEHAAKDAAIIEAALGVERRVA